jgi:uncharacterized protein (DUF3820 family)
MSDNLTPDPTILKDVMKMPMPYGKYKGTLIKNLPTYYLEWMAGTGFPAGRLGMILSTVHTIKINGLDFLLNGEGHQKFTP